MIPLIRAGALAPFVSWMQAAGRPVDALLREVDLSYYPFDDPDMPIPLRPAIAFVVRASRLEGPDLSYRVVSKESVPALGRIGRIALGSGSVREAIDRVAAALPFHSTYVVISVHPVHGGVMMREAWGLRLDDETRHFVQQYVAALIQALCAHAGAATPVFGRVALMPHPVHGLSHLRPFLGETVEPSRDGTLELFVPAEVANRSLRLASSPPSLAGIAAGSTPLRGDGSLSGSARLVVAAMLSDGTPTIERLAAAGGLSVRTFQRRLAEENTTFSHLLGSVRHELAVASLAGGGQTASEVASRLGYGQQSSLTRAVRRWTGLPPRTIVRRDAE
ncbi:AraC family transcriptional regulator [Aquibium carbonis]|uniref:AraC family transcriptional regulator n=1 Tax=Aquibium carbonis TaxID=2495581 RepID=A0A3R9YBD3_9HYPH|nr:AraC family transcriptional regulator [Aquibium carbonis]RST87407.1 AraC family transcriptional regulator [Aquibium carbonis]